MTSKRRLVGVNHVALEIDDVEEALHFYGSIFSFELRGMEMDDNDRPHIRRPGSLDEDDLTKFGRGVEFVAQYPTVTRLTDRLRAKS
ncbi:hypothetical protein [Rhizobium sp. BK377]|uniref:hypothetical protein n=1 Tax=Rhizobium sp. BK377 TaxID=2587058 RepID=UPI0016096528|nr:hypothetical protein [Rhizobium sp. BK377]MBB3464339.1 catechol 2,3-dioxygenase-like lactoylglutathione lyase family enzyme [Rhizobium sp. BK377]